MERDRKDALQGHDKRKAGRNDGALRGLPFLLIISAWMVSLAGCTAVDFTPGTVESTVMAASPVSAASPMIAASPVSSAEAAVPTGFVLSDLKNTEIFAQGALEHIFEGSVNARGVASGYHYAGIPSARGSVVSGTVSTPDANGVYEARVKVDGVKKTGNEGFSSFYPSAWTPQEVVDAIGEAYENREFVTGDTWRGKSRNVSILMYLDEENRIISAFPEYEGR